MEKLTARNSLPRSIDHVGQGLAEDFRKTPGFNEVGSLAEVYEAIQRAKASADAFCTNFFPVESRLQAWIENREVFAVSAPQMSGFLRHDRGLFHLYFCAGNPASLTYALKSCPAFTGLKMVTDIVGPESSVRPVAQLFEAQGWSPRRRLVRLARVARPVEPGTARPEVSLAGPGEAGDVLRIIEENFDRYADQLPMGYEVQDAIARGQVLICRAAATGGSSPEIGALLFFETQGFTSTIRYWVVQSAFRDRGFGSALIRHYFVFQPAVRRFILWVGAENDNAISKYRHYGYNLESLVDQVLINHALVS